jgi:PAS domain-containing protein
MPTISSAFPSLQSRHVDPQEINFALEPVIEDDPDNFHLVITPEESTSRSRPFSLERRADQLFSREHLKAIFNDATLLLRFTSFLSAHRPKSVPLLIYYLDALKAMRAINYANAIAEALEPIPGASFTDLPVRPTVNSVLEDKAEQAFDLLVQEDLPAYITHVFIQVVNISINRRITGTLAPHLRDVSEGLAEVFCLSDPSRVDNPIIFASEEFHRTTQYGVAHTIGRNCRFLQGPRTNPNSIRRLRNAVKAGKETSEVVVNYRRDGSPFLNLLMIAPLRDANGQVRYFLGAQVDVSGLAKDCTGLDGLQKVVLKEDGSLQSNRKDDKDVDKLEQDVPKDEFEELSEMFNITELDIVRRFGGRMHRQPADGVPSEVEPPLNIATRPRVVLRTSDEKKPEYPSISSGRLIGIYKDVSI